MTTTEESISYKCADLPPQIVTYTNSITNETKTESIPAKINSLQVVFDYSIFHTDDTSFGAKKAQEESKGVLESISDTISDTVNNLFGDDDEDKEGKENLVVLEKCMVENVWKAMLANDMMTWVEGDESQCAGFIIDEVSRRFLQDGNNTLIEIEQEEPIVSDNTGVDQSTQLVIDDAAMDQTQPVIIEDAAVFETAADIPDISDNEEVDDTATTFTGTKLIGMDSLPLDMINTAGCASGTSSCTFVRGIISASYIGTNENAVSVSIARMVQDGMKSGSLLCEGSPATKLEFDSFVGNGKGGHGALILDTNRGMAPEESDDLTSYGIMFVLFVALLSVGVIFGVLYKRKKKQKAMGSAAVADFESNLELEEGARSQTPDISVPSDDRMTRMVEMSANDDFGTNEVELSLSPKSVT
eukprot:CAMPEP_0201693018 /NCGR_PEP_ID=MMETSP0578-20130828/5742_1 /ASSEMBLY_ACC=CAM_ASM_000663 /TAXON_ID=267565 /ORGANISM="Skeletonema grethea, Strain CCMP 1804" /LENGTH=414 /DNA_ID=CAMNT_0048178479 /DNA_START=143 /DNA_END=1387 /DNA_ORIENTATION=-